MDSLDALDSIEWAKRVNRSWIVHYDLDRSAQAWMDYLQDEGGKRLVRSCEVARAMTRQRGSLEDPKPWFYAGLFHLATPSEAIRFLNQHRVTRATVPSMADDEAVRLWEARIGAETRALLGRLRSTLSTLQQ